MEYGILALLICNLIVLLVGIALLLRKQKTTETLSDTLLSQNREISTTAQQATLTAVGAMGQGMNENLRTLSDSLSGTVGAMKTALAENQTNFTVAQTQKLEVLDKRINDMKQALTEAQRAFAETQTQKLDGIDHHVIARQEAMNQTVEKQMQAMEQRLAQLETTSEQKLDALRKTMIDSMRLMRQENAQKLEQIQGVVDEKLQDTLQKRIAESFQTVSTQLEQVYKGLGEMQHLATDVGGLKQVLSGVKTRGILGEIQLGAILKEILAPEQYEENIATVPGSRERVEFAIRLPGTDEHPVYLPIDSKFPGDTYMHLQQSQQDGDAAALAEARKLLTAALKKSAKDIATKYVEPPHTTNFGILFLPFEGLYAEVVNLGLIEALQREYHINIAGPSTMAALLNALQMGFRTLAIQKRSNEVWKVLGEVKTEFEKFEDVMQKMQTHLRQTSEDLETLIGTRTRSINRKLKSVQKLDDAGMPVLPTGE